MDDFFIQMFLDDMTRDSDNARPILSIESENDIIEFKRVFGQIATIPKYAKLLCGKVTLAFPKYDKDPRESFQIDEIRRFIQLLDREFLYFFYFLDLDPRINQVFLWVACLLPSTSIEQHDKQVGIAIEPMTLALLLVKRIQAIEAFCEQILDDSTPIIEGLLKTQPELVAAYIADFLRVLDTYDEEEPI